METHLNDPATATLPAGFELRALDAADLPAAHNLFDAVAKALPDPTSFRLFGGAESFFSTHFGARGVSIGVFDSEGLCAYGSLTYPGVNDVDNYAGDAGWDATRAARLATLSAAMVHPRIRGRNLHRAMIEARIGMVQAHLHPELLARAAPGNAVSRTNLLAGGFAIVWAGVQREGSVRHIYWRPTVRPAADLSKAADADYEWARADDLPAQQALLAQGRIGAALRLKGAEIGYLLSRT